MLDCEIEVEEKRKKEVEQSLALLRRGWMYHAKEDVWQLREEYKNFPLAQACRVELID